MSSNSNEEQRTIIAGMATIPERYDSLPDVVSTLAPQVDRLMIAVQPMDEDIVDAALSGFPDTDLVVFHPGEEEGPRTDDARKFAPLEIAEDSDLLPDDFFFFSVDDDLLYPEDYTERMIEWIETYNREAAVCIHGSWLPLLPCDSYYQEKKAIHFQQQTVTPIQVLFPGTGTLAFHTSTIRPTLDAFPEENIADVQFGIYTNARDTPTIAVPRPENWVRQHPDVSPTENSIWADRKDDDELETQLINDFEDSVGWEFPTPPHS